MTDRHTFGRRRAQARVVAVERDLFDLLEVVGLGTALRFSVFVFVTLAVAGWLLR